MKNIPDLSHKIEIIKERVYFIRNQKVMFDKDLAELYGVEVKVLNQAVRRNIERFPPDFMFQLKKDELNEHHSLRSQIVTLESGKSGRGKYAKYDSFVFTEQGIAMLSSVLKSTRAIQVNIQIMRAFTALRRMTEMYGDVKEKIQEMEKEYGEKFTQIFKILSVLTNEGESPKKKIGFKVT